jgi:hypothetical protein
LNGLYDLCRRLGVRVIKAVPMTEEWRQHLNDLAKRRPIDSAKFFELKSTLAYGPEDHEDVERVTVQPSDRSSVIQPQYGETLLGPRPFCKPILHLWYL